MALAISLFAEMRSRSKSARALVQWLKASETPKVLVFDNTRNGAHALAAALERELRAVFGDEKAPPLHLHLGVLSATERERVESAMKTDRGGVCVATSTLEIGIDIGDIDAVVLATPPGERVPLDWARTQMDLGAALETLGKRESGTGKLTEAVAAYREALKEYTRERVPLDWAVTQMNLGNALGTLGERESGTGKLTEAVAAYREALKEYTPQTDPTNYQLTMKNLNQVLTLLKKRSGKKGAVH
jgi:tetratricopeptide (TPR) repeat protein